MLVAFSVQVALSGTRRLSTVCAPIDPVHVRSSAAAPAGAANSTVATPAPSTLLVFALIWYLSLR